MTGLIFAVTRSFPRSKANQLEALLTRAGDLEGRLLPPISVTPFTNPGTKVELRPEGPAIILVYSSDCPHCSATVPAWCDLINRAPPDVQVLGLTTDAPLVGQSLLDEFSPRHVEGFTIDSAPWGLPYIPVTLILSPDGRVAWARVGRLRPEDLAQLNKIHIPYGEEK
jgi:hypothetical protein